MEKTCTFVQVDIQPLSSIMEAQGLNCSASKRIGGRVMSRKEGWEKSTNGPDWMDVEGLMRAIGTLHSGNVAVIVTPCGTGSTGGVDVAASILFDVLPGSSLPESVIARADWPCDKHTTLAAHAFSLLYDLDHRISLVYKQESLWE